MVTVEVGETGVQGLRRDVGKSIHGGEVFGGQVAAVREEGSGCAATGAGGHCAGSHDAWSEVAAGCDVAAVGEGAEELVESVFAVERRCLVRKLTGNADRAVGGLVDERVVVIEGEGRRNEDGERQCCPELTSLVLITMLYTVDIPLKHDHPDCAAAG